MSPAAVTDAGAAPPGGRGDDGRLPGLQVLRFAAAFAVVLFHVGSGYRIEFGNASNPFGFGAFGVDVFFVLSGFIIAMTTDPARGAWYFCRRRLARVVPLYWFLTLGVAAVGLALPSLLNSTVVTGEAILKSLLFIPFARPDGAVQPLLFLGWTLNYEMFFYAIYAACLLLGLRSPLAVVAVVGALVAAGRLLPADDVPWRFYTSPLLLEFALGVGLCLLHRRRPAWFEGRGALLLVTGIALFVLLRLVPGLHWVIASGLPAGILVAAFAALPLGGSRWVGPLVLLGDASYSLYLVHPYIIQILSKLAPGDLGIAGQVGLGVVSCLLCIAASLVLYRLVEIPSKNLLMPRRRRPLREGARAEA